MSSRRKKHVYAPNSPYYSYRKPKFIEHPAAKVLVFLVCVFITIVGVKHFYDEGKYKYSINIPEHTEYFYVEDYSGVLNQKTEKYILDEAVKLNKATSAQVVVVTVPNTQHQSLEDFSIELANEWGIGDRALDNGVLLLFTTAYDDPHVRLEIGKGLEGAISDGKAGRILDKYAVEPKDDGLWNTAAGDTFTAVIKEVYKEYGKEVPASVTSQEWEDENAPTKGTFADSDFPGPVLIANDDPFFEQLIDAIIMFGYHAFLVIMIFMVIFYTIFDRGNGSSSGRGGFFGGGLSGGSSGGGGYSGGGGSFGGGGASR